MIFRKIPPQELVDFTKSLAMMLKSGISISEALSSLAEQTRSHKFRTILYKVRKDVETGTSLSEAFDKERKAFGNVAIGVIRAGETSGTLEENLTFLGEWFERNNDLAQEINNALLYPKIVFSAALLLGGSLAVFILPRLVPLFTSLNVELPLITRILLKFSLFVRDFWLVLFFIILGSILAFVLINKNKIVRRFFHYFYIRIPLFGSLLIDYQLALMSQLFFTLFGSGLSINESLDITSEAVTNIQYQEAIKKIKTRITKGTTLSQAMKDYPALFPKNLINIIAVGEKSGSLNDSFSHLAEFYSKEVKTKTKRLPIIIEPALLIFIGLVVGFIALSIILPIYKITGSLSQ